MNLKAIRDSIIARVGNDTELQVGDFNTFINEGASKIYAKILDERKDFFPDEETLTGTGSVTPTKSWTQITLITADFGDGRGEHPIHAIPLEVAVDSTNTTEGFCIWGSAIKIAPISTAVTVKIYGYVVPADLSQDSVSPAFDALLHPLLITWGHACAVEAASADTNFLDGQRKRQEFWDDLERILPTVIHKDSTNSTSLI